MTGPSWVGPYRTPEGVDEVLVPCDLCGQPVYESCRTRWRERGRRDCGVFCDFLGVAGDQRREVVSPTGDTETSTGDSCRDGELSEPTATTTAPTTEKENPVISIETPKKVTVDVLAAPAWASETTSNHDIDTTAFLTHRYTAPSTGIGGCGGDDGEPWLLTVSLIADDTMRIRDGRVVLDRDPVVVFLDQLDTSFASTAEARKFAAAIVECCDRLDGAQ